MFCQKCGNEIPEGTKFCTSCGAPVEDTAPENMTRDAAPAPAPVPAPANHAAVPGKTAATASLVLGIVGVALWFFGFWFVYGGLISIALGVVGIILSVNSKKAGFNGGIRTAGLVLSIIAVVGGAIAFIACLTCYGAANEAVKNLDDAADTLKDLQ